MEGEVKQIFVEKNVGWERGVSLGRRRRVGVGGGSRKQPWQGYFPATSVFTRPSVGSLLNQPWLLCALPSLPQTIAWLSELFTPIQHVGG